MKQAMSLEEIQKSFGYDDSEFLADMLNSSVEDLPMLLTIGKLLELLRTFHQIDLYTVGDYWCIQLFDLHVAANDQQDCVAESHAIELIDVLCKALSEIIEERQL